MNNIQYRLSSRNSFSSSLRSSPIPPSYITNNFRNLPLVASAPLLSPYYSAVIKPKILITTRPRPSAELFHFISAILTMIPNSYYYPRRDYELKDITTYSRNKMFSHLIVLSEKSKKCNGMLVSHLGVPSESSGIWKDDGGKVWEDDDNEEDWGEEEEDNMEVEVDEDGEGIGGLKGNGSSSNNDDEEGLSDSEDDDEDNSNNHDNHQDPDEHTSSEPEFPAPSSPKVPTPTPEDVLPGPTAFFKVNNIGEKFVSYSAMQYTSLRHAPSVLRFSPSPFRFSLALIALISVLPRRISNHGKATSHIPEIILNNFTTRLGHRAGRFFGSLFPHSPEFNGRQAVTFHNQRDYVFVRHHRYVFHKGERKGDNGKTRARLQELGPRFSLKMRWMLSGGFDTRFGEYEFFHKRKEMDTSRRKFHL